MKRLITLIAIFILVLLSSCAYLGQTQDVDTPDNPVNVESGSTDDKTNTGTVPEEITEETDAVTTVEGIDKITEDDFIVVYDNITISGQIPFNDIAAQLGIDLDDDSNRDLWAYVSNGDYSWYLLHYPSRENEDLTIKYVVNGTLNESYLVSIDLLNQKTFRGIKVGENLTKLLQVYGTIVEGQYNNENENSYRYILAGDTTKGIPEKELCILVNTMTEQITGITLDYGSNEIMAKMGVVAFD